MSRSEAVTALVVDDNATKRYIIGSWLRRAGHTVLEASSAAQTWERLAEHAVDLVVLDVRLPDMSGVEVCERIRADPATASTPVIHISAAAVDAADRAHGLRRGADAYLTDPIDPTEFLATVEAMLRYYRALRRAERLAERTAALTRHSLAVNAAETFEELALVAADSAYDIFGVPASVFLMPPDGRVRRTVGHRAGPEFRQCSPERFGRLTSLTDLGEATGTKVLPLDGPRWKALVPDTVVDGDVALVLSRVKRGRPPICVAIHVEGVPGQEDLDLLRQLGQTLALAMEAMRSFTEQHLISLTLQRSLLPALRPSVPGWEFAVRYEPASDQAEVGGDFYEVLDRGDHVLIAIGDVQGHSLVAATVMAEIRHALRAFAEEGHDGETILRLLNGVMQRYHDDQTATVCIMTLDPRTGWLRVASGGHLPPLFVADGAARYGRGGGLLLGFPAERIEIEETVVPPGGMVMLITDGLIEDRGVSLTDNLERLRDVAVRVDEDLERFSDRVIAEFGHREDDVAMIVIRRDPAESSSVS